MCCGTNIFINTPRIGQPCCRNTVITNFGVGNFSPGCFGYGYSGCTPANFAMMGVGMGAGMALGSMLGTALPGVFKGIGTACGFVWNKALVPAGKFLGNIGTTVWNNALVPTGRFLGNMFQGAWNGIKSAASWIGNGVKNLWNKIFHPKG